MQYFALWRKPDKESWPSTTTYPPHHPISLQVAIKSIFSLACYLAVKGNRLHPLHLEAFWRHTKKKKKKTQLGRKPWQFGQRSCFDPVNGLRGKRWIYCFAANVTFCPTRHGGNVFFLRLHKGNTVSKTPLSIEVSSQTQNLLQNTTRQCRLQVYSIAQATILRSSTEFLSLNLIQF